MKILLVHKVIIIFEIYNELLFIHILFSSSTILNINSYVIINKPVREKGPNLAFLLTIFLTIRRIKLSQNSIIFVRTI